MSRVVEFFFAYLLSYVLPSSSRSRVLARIYSLSRLGGTYIFFPGNQRSLSSMYFNFVWLMEEVTRHLAASFLHIDIVES